MATSSLLAAPFGSVSIFVTWVAVILLTARSAIKRRRDPIVWGLAASCFSVFAWLTVVVIGPADPLD